MTSQFLPVLLFTSVLATAHADTIFQEDFSGIENPQGLVQWQGNKNLVSEADGVWMEVVVDESDGFGKGAENRILVLHDRSDSSAINLYAKFKGAEDVVTLSFDFVEPPDAESGAAVVRIGTAGNEASELAVNIALRDGSFEHGPDSVYGVGTKHKLTIVANNSPEAVTYGGVNLLSQRYDVYIDDEHVLKAAPFNTEDATLSPGVPLDSLRLLTYISTTKDQTLQIDNVVVKNGAHAP